jgi:uncharacterized RDD family membrane protein YckC
MVSAGLARRLAASGYEGLLLAALLIGAGFALLPAVTPAPGPASAPTATGLAATPLYALSPAARRLSGTVLFALAGLYCGWFWSGERHSLPMRAWRLTLRTAAGGPPSLPQATLRYLACWAGPALAIASYQVLQPWGQGRWALLALTFNYAWALVDRERQYLQDRLAGTRLTLAEPGR